MCTFCSEYGHGDQWYYNLENHLFNKVFPTPEEKEDAKRKRIAAMSDIEWREDDPTYPLGAWTGPRSGSGSVVTLEEALKVMNVASEAVKREDSMIALGRCGCAHRLRGKLEYRCIFMGIPVTWASEVGYAKYPKEGLTEFGGAEWREMRRELKKGARTIVSADEAKELFTDWDKKGLVHVVVSRGFMPLIDGFCNCELPICRRMRDRLDGGKQDRLIKGHTVARVDQSKCISCGLCMQMCHFGAIHTSRWSKMTHIDPTRCFGCGLCRAVCKKDAIAMVPRAKQPVARELW